MSEELKPCRECGCGRIEVDTKPHFSVFYIKCSLCGASSGRKFSAEEAIAAWNRSAIPSNPGELDRDAVIEQCAQVCDPYTHGQWFAEAIRALKGK